MLKQSPTPSTPTAGVPTPSADTTPTTPTQHPHDEAKVITECDNGLIVRHRFYPSQEVWAIVKDRKRKCRVIKVSAEHRSAVTTHCDNSSLNSTFRYTLDDGSVKTDTEVFATEEELKEWI